MSYLISTTRYLLGFDPDRQTWRIVHQGNGLYYGLCATQDHLYASCRNALEGPKDETVRAREQGSVLVLGKDLHLQQELQPPFPLRDVHGIGWISGRLWVTCSYDNLIAIFDPAAGSWRQWYPKPDIQGRDANHFNTIELLHGEVHLLAHNFGLSEIYVYGEPDLSLQRTLSLGEQAHDFFFINGSLAVCSSGTGELRSTAGDCIETGEFPRGYAEDEQRRLVGLSALAQRSDRASSDSRVRVFSPEWQEQGDFLLNGVGMVLAILRLPEGFRCDGFPLWNDWTYQPHT